MKLIKHTIKYNTSYINQTKLHSTMKTPKNKTKLTLKHMFSDLWVCCVPKAVREREREAVRL